MDRETTRSVRRITGEVSRVERVHALRRSRRSDRRGAGWLAGVLLCLSAGISLAQSLPPWTEARAPRNQAPEAGPQPHRPMSVRCLSLTRPLRPVQQGFPSAHA